MKRLFLALFVLLIALVFSTRGSYAGGYAIVVKDQTLAKPEWAEVVDTLKAKYQGEVLVYDLGVSQVLDSLKEMSPKYVCFVLEPLDSRDYVVKTIHRLTRELDDDPYGDAIWGIVTGYTPQDALRIVSISGFRVRRILSGTSKKWLPYVQEGIATSEGTYNKMWVKYPDGTIVDTVECPTDRTPFLVEKLNSNQYDIFITSGHGNVNRWQLHYPTSDKEGFFRSRDGQVYGDPYEGDDINIDSTNPKIYCGLGNCYIGKILQMEDSMVLAWLHSGGAYMYAGYVTPEGRNSYQLGGTAAYFFIQNQCTWPEAFFLSNQAIVFDLENDTPGSTPADRDYAALYGDPALDVRIEPVRDPLYRSEISVRSGADRDTVTVRITMNEDGKPGFTSKWGNRHPIVMLPCRVENPQVEYTDAYRAVVTDNFALLYVWKQGDPDLTKGEEREVVFTTTTRLSTDVEETPQSSLPCPIKPMLFQAYPNPVSRWTTIGYRVPSPTFISLNIYDVAGRLVRPLVATHQQLGYYTARWDGKDRFGQEVASGVYIYRLLAEDSTCSRKLVVVK